MEKWTLKKSPHKQISTRLKQKTGQEQINSWCFCFKLFTNWGWCLWVNYICFTCEDYFCKLLTQEIEDFDLHCPCKLLQCFNKFIFIEILRCFGFINYLWKKIMKHCLAFILIAEIGHTLLFLSCMDLPQQPTAVSAFFSTRFVMLFMFLGGPPLFSPVN